MERRLPLIFSFIFLFISFLSGQSLSQDRKIQILLWAEKEAYPGINWAEGTVNWAETTGDENEFSLPVSRLKKTAPFFVQGMLYGWKIDYTPSDKARGVQEYLEFEPVQDLTEEEVSRIEYKNAAFKDDRLYCRVEFERTDFQLNLFKSWQSVTNPKVRGFGYGRLEDGFEGLKAACGEAMKNAVREYWRRIIKNKPREISGRLVLCAAPVIGVDSGRYRVMLDFLMETDRILDYKMF
jgi:hypothetical protein